MPIISRGNISNQTAVVSSIARFRPKEIVCIHYYPTTSDTAVSDLAALLDDVYDLYGLPIRLTMFSLVDGTQVFTAQEQAEFASAAVALLEARDEVERYAWFTTWDAGISTFQNGELINADGSLSPVGRVYSLLP